MSRSAVSARFQALDIGRPTSDGRVSRVGTLEPSSPFPHGKGPPQPTGQEKAQRPQRPCFAHSALHSTQHLRGLQSINIWRLHTTPKQQQSDFPRDIHRGLATQDQNPIRTDCNGLLIACPAPNHQRSPEGGIATLQSNPHRRSRSARWSHGVPELSGQAPPGPWTSAPPQPTRTNQAHSPTDVLFK